MLILNMNTNCGGSVRVLIVSCKAWVMTGEVKRTVPWSSDETSQSDQDRVVHIASGRKQVELHDPDHP